MNIWLKGGFGNTLFQITHALSVHYSTNQNTLLISNLTERNLITKTLNWTIHEPVYLEFIKNSCLPLNISRATLPRVIWVLIKAFLSKRLSRNIDNVRYFQSSNSPENIKHQFGYFQNSDCNEFYVKAFDSVILELRSQYFEQNKNSVVIHFRWGDSDQAKNSGRYYNRVKSAISEMEYCTIVTDSPKVAENFFTDCINCEIIKRDSVSDFRILISADILFCAPSTFSWWAGQASYAEKIYMPLELRDFTYINENRFKYL